MKISMRIRHNGKEYKTIEDATLAAMISGIRATMEKTVAPFYDEITKEGGQITMNIDGDSMESLKASLEITNVSADLKKRFNESIK